MCVCVCVRSCTHITHLQVTGLGEGATIDIKLQSAYRAPKRQVFTTSFSSTRADVLWSAGNIIENCPENKSEQRYKITELGGNLEPV